MGKTKDTLDAIGAKAPSIKWENTILYFQRKFETWIKNKNGIGSYTIEAIPDVVIEKLHPGKRELYIFDAKMREIWEILSESKKQDARRNAIAQMHRYKECIVEFSTKHRIVKGAYMVVPDTGNLLFEEDKWFTQPEYRKEWGFGFITMKPTGEKEGVTWLIK